MFKGCFQELLESACAPAHPSLGSEIRHVGADEAHLVTGSCPPRAGGGSAVSRADSRVRVGIPGGAGSSLAAGSPWAK